MSKEELRKEFEAEGLVHTDKLRLHTYIAWLESRLANEGKYSDSKLKVGDILTAIDRCVMNNSGKAALTIGGAYKIIKIDDVELVIKDDANQNHWYELATLDKYFTAAPSKEGGNNG